MDTPNAHQVAGKFMARAVADEVIAPRYVTSRPGPQDSDEAALAFAKARGLITTPQGLSRLAYVWGSNGARSPVDELRSKVSLMLGELVLTGDLAEAEICTRELRAKHFLHEVVFQAIELAIDGRSERDMLLLSAFLKRLCNSAIVSEGQLKNGLDRIVESMGDIQLDNPHAALNLDSFCRVSSSFLPQKFCAVVAQQAKRAMVSCPRTLRTRLHGLTFASCICRISREAAVFAASRCPTPSRRTRLLIRLTVWIS